MFFTWREGNHTNVNNYKLLPVIISFQACYAAYLLSVLSLNDGTLSFGVMTVGLEFTVISNKCPLQWSKYMCIEPLSEFVFFFKYAGLRSIRTAGATSVDVT